MSATIDRQRKEDARDAALDRAKEKLRLLQAITTRFAEGLSASKTAPLVGVCERTVRKWWGLLELSTRRGQKKQASTGAA